MFGDLFAQLDQEEEAEEEVGKKHEKYPDFGDANSTREEVYAFYSGWENLQTLKQFTYVDNYNPNEAPNRRIKRIIEQENKKERRKEQTRFNDKLYDLLIHIKKHDPRY